MVLLGVKMKNFLRVIRSHSNRVYNLVNGLINKHHYNFKQQHLYSLIKKYKDNQHLSYKRISELLFKDGYRSIRKNKVLKPNYVWSIYKKGQQRDNRISSHLRSFSNIKLIVK